MNPKVSIGLPLYNTGKYLKQTIESILDQTFEDFELIICDNASTDNSAEIVKEFKDKRIRFYQNDKEIPGVENWNKCVDLAKGELVALFHSDDVYEPTIIEEEVAAFKKNPSLGAVFTLGNWIDENGKKVGEFTLDPYLKGKTVFNFYEMLTHLLRGASTIMVCPTVMVPKKIYQEVGKYRQIKWVFDYEYYLRILEKYDIAIINKNLINYRKHAEQGTANWLNKRTEMDETFNLIDKFLKKYKDSPLLKEHLSKDSIKIYEARKMNDFSMRAYNATMLEDYPLALKLIRKAMGIKRLDLFDPILWLGLRLGLGNKMKSLVKRIKVRE